MLSFNAYCLPEEQQDFCDVPVEEQPCFGVALDEQLPLFFFFLRLSSSFLTISKPFTAA